MNLICLKIVRFYAKHGLFGFACLFISAVVVVVGFIGFFFCFVFFTLIFLCRTSDCVPGSTMRGSVAGCDWCSLRHTICHSQSTQEAKNSPGAQETTKRSTPGTIFIFFVTGDKSILQYCFEHG